MNTTIWWLAFGIILGIYTIASIALLYHWHRYRLENKRVRLAQFVYFAGSLALIVWSFALFNQLTS